MYPHFLGPFTKHTPRYGIRRLTPCKIIILEQKMIPPSILQFGPPYPPIPGSPIFGGGGSIDPPPFPLPPVENPTSRRPFACVYCTLCVVCTFVCRQPLKQSFRGVGNCWWRTSGDRWPAATRKWQPIGDDWPVTAGSGPSHARGLSFADREQWLRAVCLDNPGPWHP